MKHVIKISTPFLEKFEIDKFSSLLDIKHMLVELGVPVKKVINITFQEYEATVHFMIMDCIEYFYLSAASNHYADNSTLEVEINRYINQDRIEAKFAHLVSKDTGNKLPEFMLRKEYNLSDEEVAKMRVEELEKFNNSRPNSSEKDIENTNY